MIKKLIGDLEDIKETQLRLQKMNIIKCELKNSGR